MQTSEQRLAVCEQVKMKDSHCINLIHESFVGVASVAVAVLCESETH